MTASTLLKQARPGEFVGQYVAPVPGSDERVPVVDVYTGSVPADVDRNGVKIYEFMPIAGAERDVSGEPLATAAIDGVEKAEDGRVSANLTLVVSGSENSSDAVAQNPVTEGGSRFGRLFQLLTREDGVDRLLVEPTDTNVSQVQLERLGFQAVDGSDMLQLDLPTDTQTRVAA